MHLACWDIRICIWCRGSIDKYFVVSWCYAKNSVLFHHLDSTSSRSLCVSCTMSLLQKIRGRSKTICTNNTEEELKGPDHSSEIAAAVARLQMNDSFNGSKPRQSSQRNLPPKDPGDDEKVKDSTDHTPNSTNDSTEHSTALNSPKKSKPISKLMKTKKTINIGDLLNAEVERPQLSAVTSPSVGISWRKKGCKLSIEDFYEDKELFNSLLSYMRRIYCSESIFFLCAVQQYEKEVQELIAKMERNDKEQVDLMTTLQEHEQMQQIIDFRARGIFNCYIVSGAPHQVKRFSDIATYSSYCTLRTVHFVLYTSSYNISAVDTPHSVFTKCFCVAFRWNVFCVSWSSPNYFCCELNQKWCRLTWCIIIYIYICGDRTDQFGIRLLQLCGSIWGDIGNGDHSKEIDDVRSVRARNRNADLRLGVDSILRIRRIQKD